MQATTQRRSSTLTAAAPALQSLPSDLFSDSRLHGHQGPTRNVRFPRAAASGGGTVAKSEDGVRCVVAGRECSSNCPFSVRPLLTMVSSSPARPSLVGSGRHFNHGPKVGRRPRRAPRRPFQEPLGWQWAQDRERKHRRGVVYWQLVFFFLFFAPRPAQNTEIAGRLQQQDTDEREERRSHHVGLGQARQHQVR